MNYRLVIIFTVLMAVFAAGCTDSNVNSNFSSYNNSINLNISNNNSSISNQPSNVHYEASGFCPYVVDGDTIDVNGVGRIRLVGVNTPERGQPGYQEAKDFVKSLCLHKIVYLDIDNAKHYDKYGRVLAVVYAGNTNVNAELLKRGYAEVMYIPPSEFNPYSWSG